MQPLGRHLIMDAWECNEQINSVEAIEEALREAVRRSRATLVQLVVHPFSPYGASGVAVIAESHIAIHTWPEEGYFSLDVYTCGEKALPEAALEVFKERFQPQRIQVVELPRGRWLGEEHELTAAAMAAVAAESC
jgi:S-adenosylmethionine decarboxylase